MKIWNYICEFLLFRWQFGKQGRCHNVGNSHLVDTTDDTPRRVDIEDYIANDLDNDLSAMNYPATRYSARHPYRGADIYDDEDDAIADYDPTDGDDTSFNDFMDEQDDYDMMDDDF